MLYDNIEDARTKLQGTLVYYGDKGYWCDEVHNENGPIELRLRRADAQKRLNIKLGDPDLRYMEYTIGYVNYGGRASWWYRLPVRQYRQGLRGDSLAYRDESGQQNGREIRFNDHARQTTCFVDMLEAKYPTFKEACRLIKEEGQSKVAFHTHFAVYYDKYRKDYVIEYKGRPSATTKDLGECSPINEEVFFLREVLAEAGLKVK